MKISRTDLPIWKDILEQLESGEMPPKKNAFPPLAPGDRQRLVVWIRSVLERELRVHAGDPGPAMLRRLTHAEYDNTVRDLAGNDLRPAREFPAEGAGGEGFANASEALEISPELLTKYFASAKQIAACAVLMPDRIRFSSSSFQQDWANESAAELAAFYAKWTDNGKIPLERYLSALVRHRESLASEKLTFRAVAEQEVISERYLEALGQFLYEEQPPNIFLKRLRSEWKTAQARESSALAAQIDGWQQVLWSSRTESMKVVIEPARPTFAFGPQSFSIISNNFKSPQAVFFIGARAFTAAERTYIRWGNPRFEALGKPSIPLREMLLKAGHERIPAEAPPPEPRPTEVTRNKDGIVVGVPWVPQLELDRFGRHPLGKPMDKNSFVTSGSEVVAIRIPTELIGEVDPTKGHTIAGLTFVVEAHLDAESAIETVVQVNVQSARVRDELINPLLTATGGPIYFAEAKGVSAEKLQKDADEFRRMFPAVACLTNVSLVGGGDRIHPQDEPLLRLLLNQDQTSQYERLWDDFSFVSREAIVRLGPLNAFANGEDAGLESRRKEVERAAESLRQELIAAEPVHLQAVLDLAGRAFRRPLTETERQRFRSLYQELRNKELPHDESIRAAVASVFVAPEFLYRLEKSPPGKLPGRLSEADLASRLSYFLWATMPDRELIQLVVEGKMHDPAVLEAQTRRMLKDERTRGLAIEFAAQWLGIRGFDEFQGRDENLFPAFTKSLRADLYEESVLFLADLFRSDLSVTSLLDADHTFLNESLAQYYGVPGVQGAGWRRVGGVQKYGRGGVLGFASLLTKHSGASRTSPVLRGIFVVDRLLGDKIPTPPKGVPTLPEAEDPTGLTVRQLVERHVQDASCATCHQRIDPIGFALENFDTIGRWRDKDLTGRPVDARAQAIGGVEFEGIAGLRKYLLDQRKSDFERQFCKKLLGYALGRSVAFSDQSLLDEMRKALGQADGRVSAAVLVIVRSPQFQSIRGADFGADEADRP